VKDFLRSPEAGYFLAAVTLLIWASFVVVSRVGGQGTLTVFDIAALRIGTAALVLSPWWVPRLLRPSSRRLTWTRSLLFALLAGIGYPLLAYTGVKFAPASHGAVLISGVLPMFTALLALMLMGERPSPTRIAGLLLITFGVGVLFASQLTRAVVDSEVVTGDLILLAASFTWGLFTVLLKRWAVRAFDVTLGVVAVSAMVYLPIYVLFLPKHIAQTAMPPIVLQGLFQGVIVVCVALWTYTKAAELIGPVRLVIMLAGVPVVGVLLSVAFLGETLSTGAALGATLVFLGALLGAMARPANPSPAK
jgi:drug/metabolite transporter (DMT)-like permease